MSERLRLAFANGAALSIDLADITEVSVGAEIRELEPENGWARRELTGGGVVTLKIRDISSARWENTGQTEAA